MKNKTTTYKWAYLPFVFSSAAILATQVTAAPTGSQQYQDARQVNSINHEYVGGNTQLGFGVTDDGDADVEFNQVLSETDNHSTGVGLWAGYDLKGDDKGVLGRGVQLNHNWVSRDNAGRAIRVNKVFGAYDRDEAGHDKATVGYGQENQNLFWEGHVSKGLSDRKDGREVAGKIVSDQAYDYGVGGSVGKFMPGSNTRVRAGLDHEWSDEVAADEKDARNTTLSAGIEKFFQGTGHSVSLDVAGSKRSGGYQDGGSDDTDVTGRLGYRYDFGGASIYQPDRRYKRVRVEVPGRAVSTFKTVPVYAKKTIRTPYKQLVKSTMELEGQTFFKKNSDKIIPSAQTRLKQIAAQIRKSGYKGSIRITGNTCGLGSVKYDQILSEKRANAVRSYLIKNGFNANHLIARGLGKGHPKYPNTPDQGFKNRRVDIEYVSEQKIYKTGYKTEHKKVQTGTRRIATGRPGTPRVIWKTEVIPTSPAWIKRALHNNIKHNTSVNTFETTAGTPAAPKNLAPRAVNDHRSVACSAPITINVLGNDTDPDGDALTVTSFTQPAHGTVTRAANGQLVYTSDGTSCGADDKFTYTISDGNGHSSTATVTVSVNEPVVIPEPEPEPEPVDDDVKAVNDYVMTLVNNPVTINVLKNDDSDASITRLKSGPSNGTARIVNGKFVYTPNRDFTGSDSFVYEVTDPNGNLAMATVFVTINEAQNTAPIAVDDATKVNCGAPVVIDVLANDTDRDRHALSVLSFTQPANGSVTKNAKGQLVYTSNGINCGINDKFTYTVTDGRGGTDTATVTVMVNEAPNTAPVAVDDKTTTLENTEVTLNTLANDSDPDGDKLTITKVAKPSNGTAVISGGQIIYTPNNGFTGTDKFTYTISDGNGGTATATEIVVVKPGNKAPVANDDTTSAGCDAVTIKVLDNDRDPDGDSLSIVGVSGANMGKTVISGSTIVYTPTQTCGEVKDGTDKFNYTISDGNGHKASAYVTVNLKAEDCNGKCIDAEPDDATTWVDEAVVINVLDNDAGSGLRITSVDTPKNGTAMIMGGSIKYIPASGFTGTDSFWYDIVDAKGNKDAALILVYVEEMYSKDNAMGDVEILK